MTAKTYPVQRHVPVTFNMEVPPPPPAGLDPFHFGLVSPIKGGMGPCTPFSYASDSGVANGGQSEGAK